MAFMIESRWVFHPTDYALETGALDEDYDQVWTGFRRRNLPDSTSAYSGRHGRSTVRLPDRET